jgi:hypothetical protein
MLPAAGYLIRMLDGRIDVQGTVTDLRQQGLLKELVAKEEEEVNSANANAKLNTNGEEEEKNAIDRKNMGAGKDRKDRKDRKEVNKLVEEERIAEGRVKFSVYRSYIKAS